jgi:hypothetical protein
LISNTLKINILYMKIKFYLLIVTLFWLNVCAIQAQEVVQKDLIDIVHQVFRTKPDTSRLDTRKIQFSILPAVGYTLSTSFAANVTGNMAFYTNPADPTNLSVIFISPTYTQNKQLSIPLQANIWSANRDYNFIVDWRFHKYPQNTYGLGSHTLPSDVDAIQFTNFRCYQTILKKMTPDFYVGLGYNLDYFWNITEKGTANGNISDAKKYGLTNKSFSSGVTVSLVHDDRRNPINPVGGGSYANIVYRSNLTALGSHENTQTLYADFRKYFRFPAGSDNVLGFWNLNWLTLSGNPPYLELPSTGYDDFNGTGRGYVQSRFRGKNMLYIESEYRFKILKNGLLNGVVFANAQSFSETATNKFEKILPATGFGVRIKLNKHSNTNIAIDYAFGKGSNGVFVNLGEVF